MEAPAGAEAVWLGVSPPPEILSDIGLSGLCARRDLYTRRLPEGSWLWLTGAVVR